MRGAAWVGGLVVLSALACSGPPIQQRVVDQVAGELCAIGHPNGTFTGAEITNWERGGLEHKSHDRYVDVAIHYDRPNDPGHTMLVRLYLEKLEPCRISVDVLEDSGPAPVLLDNALSSSVVGEEICKAMVP